MVLKKFIKIKTPEKAPMDLIVSDELQVTSMKAINVHALAMKTI